MPPETPQHAIMKDEGHEAISPDALCRLLEAITTDHGYRAVSVQVEARDLKDSEAVENFVAASDWAEAVGWIARQSEVVFLPVAPGDDALGVALGHVVEAELGTKSKSVQIRRAKGAWRATVIREGLTENNTAENNGAEKMLCDDVVFLMTSGKAARYRRYWRCLEPGPEAGAVEICACRLVQFEEVQ